MRVFSPALSLPSEIAPALAFAADAPTGDIIVDVRLRHEIVDQHGPASNAKALALRAGLGHDTPDGICSKAVAEVKNVTALERGRNSTTNGEVGYRAISDQQARELNRAQLSWSSKQTDLVLGLKPSPRAWPLKLQAAAHASPITGARCNGRELEATCVLPLNENLTAEARSASSTARGQGLPIATSCG